MVIVDTNAPPCERMYGKRRCGSTRASYQADSYFDRDAPKPGWQRFAKRVCEGCRHVSTVDVEWGVPLALHTVEEWREWWSRVYGYSYAPQPMAYALDPDSGHGRIYDDRQSIPDEELP